MPSALRWIFKKPSKIIMILLILLVIILFHTEICYATESPNRTLTETRSYNFTDGIYNVVKYSEYNDDSFVILHETKIPYLNLSYTAPTDGYLDIYLQPIDGPYPYIELEKKWEIKSTRYSTNLEENESVYFLIYPPLIFTDYNSSRVIGGGLTLWELYEWPSISGLVNYTFTPSEKITFKIVSFPTSPKPGERINLFADSNVNIYNLSWNIVGNSIDWVNKTDLLIIDGLEAGEYTISLEGFDEFNGRHIAQEMIAVKPPIIEPTRFRVKFFSIAYPESADLGDTISISANIDYTIPYRLEVKCVLTNPETGEKYKESNYIFQNGGSDTFNYHFEATKSGVNKFLLQIFYSDGINWAELTGDQRYFTIFVNLPGEAQKMPGYNYISMFIGLMMAIFYFRRKIFGDKIRYASLSSGL